MSYDYNALVSRVASSRRKAAQASDLADKLQHLQEVVDTFATLSGNCPMTPLLWMQYSKDMADLLLCLSGEDNMSEAAASAFTTRTQLLELALAEFPGSAILQLRYLQILLQNEVDEEKVESAFTSAFENVGKGSHRNEGVLILAIFQLAIDFYTRKGKMEKALELFVERAQTPMKDVNETLMTDLEDFWTNHCSELSEQQRQKTFHLVDEARRYESKTFNFLVSCEDEIDVAMHQERILPRHQVDLDQLQWDKVLQSDDKICWMGFGGMLSSNAFIQYAQACYRYRVRIGGKKNDLSEEEQQQIKEDETIVHNLALCVYERGVAECPTVESLWLSYIRHLEYVALKDKALLPRLKSVVDRSVRNCPYSFTLYQQKLELQGYLANLGVTILDPDELQKTVQEAIDLKFIPLKETCLELYMTATRVLRRRVLVLLAKAPTPGTKLQATLPYDAVESFDPTKNSPTYSDLDDDAIQELEDLCEDCHEFYETIDTYLRKNHGSWTEGRGRLWSERAYMEAHLFAPLSLMFGDETDIDSNVSMKPLTEVAKSYDKLIKVYQPAHPDCYTDYIHSVRNLFPTRKPSSLITKLRHLRLLYENAVKNTGKPKHQTEPPDPLLQRDFESGLRNLCYEYLVFERYFGSEKSLASASSAIQKKLSKFISSQTTVQQHPSVEQVGLGYSSSPQGITPMHVDNHQLSTDLTETTTLIPKKRSKEESDDDKEHVSKKAKIEGGSEGPSTILGSSSAAGHKIKVGNLEYPTHPFTVRVLDLSSDTDDMDLIDTFRPKCGSIVHARIVREKHPLGKGKSKGWGLIQFEVQESVEKALALSEVIGIREKLIKVDRSHMPAIGLVPPGMHRVKPKGEGKSSKKNQKHREAKGFDPQSKESAEEVDVPAKTSDTTKAPDISSNSGMGVLAFKPRGVQQSQKHRKVKISLNSATAGN